MSDWLIVEIKYSPIIKGIPKIMILKISLIIDVIKLSVGVVITWSIISDVFNSPKLEKKLDTKWRKPSTKILFVFKKRFDFGSVIWFYASD